MSSLFCGAGCARNMAKPEWAGGLARFDFNTSETDEIEIRKGQNVCFLDKNIGPLCEKGHNGMQYRPFHNAI